jgi:acyl transferase domain-containing protein/acyl carrier protein
VLAVVAGSAVNQDGASNGLTAPNGPSQQRVIRAALARAGLSADEVDVVEGHGTGTVLGDPIEAQALLATYGQGRDADRPLWLGSVKSNIGHAQAAAGVAGVIKMVMALRHQVLPATLHADEPSPHVDWSAGGVRLLTEPVPWPSEDDRLRRAGVSSFGMSGTNAHLIVAEPSAAEAAPETAGPVPGAAGGGGLAWLVSGRTSDALAAQAGRLAGFVAGRPDLDPADVGWSLAATRSVFEYRAVVTGGDRAELVAGLAAVSAGEPAAGVLSGVAGEAGKVAFVFPGQGGQWAGMGRELAGCSPVFAARLAECASALAPWVDWDLGQVLAGAEGAPGLERADVVQPVLWAVMVSLAALWQAAGVTPDAVVGHSQGEIAAACVAGVLTLEDAAEVVALRSRALGALAGRGGMVSVAEPADRVRDRLASWGERLAVAAVNGPAATVVSGDPGALAELAAQCAGEGVRARTLAVDYASHSPQVEQVRGDLLAALEGVAGCPARVPMVSAMTGQWLAGPDAGAGYWYDSLRAPVEFDRAVRVLAEAGHTVFIEVSPHPVLGGPVTQTLEDSADGSAAVVSGTLRRDDGGPRRFLASMAALHVSGIHIDWAAVLAAGRRVDLPTYAFQHQRYWPRPSPAAMIPAGGDGAGAVAEARFWAAVEGGDLEALSRTLAVDDRRLGDLAPVLASWRRRERDRSVTGSWRYRVSWVPVADPGLGLLSGTWLVVVPAGLADSDLAGDCERALAARGAEATVIEAPAGPDRAMLAGQITQALPAGRLDGVLSLLALDETPVAGFPVVAEGLAGMLALVQALGDAGVDAPLWAITCGAVAAGGSQTLASPVQAMAWGLGRVAGLELPDRWGGLIDVPPVLDEQAAARLCAVLAGCGEDQVAIRGAGIMARRLVRASLPTGHREGWAPRGSVLITGGTGAIGRHVARWLTGRGAARIVLASRSGPAAPAAAALAAQLADSGSAVSITACDLTERAQVAGLLTTIASAGPPLTTVMHTSAVLDDGVLDKLSTPRLATVLAAKAAGAVHLDELTAGLDLDAFVLFSGAAGTLGNGGQGNYAAANAFLDALAQQRRAAGRVALSVAWGPWAGDGLAQQAATQQRLRRDGMRLMDADLAIKALSQALDGGDSRLTVMDVDWARFASVTGAAELPLFRDLPEVGQLARDHGSAAGQSEVRLAQRLAGVPKAEQGRVILKLIQAEAAAVLGHSSPETVKAARTFRDLGFDSLTAVELRNRLGAATGLRLPATLVFDYPNAVVLAEYLQARSLDQETDYLPVMEELDKLESILSSITQNGDERSRITARLEIIMREFRAQPVDKPAIGDQLGVATDDEMFDLVERELRASDSD